MKAAWDSWKYDTFAKAKAEIERKKANVIDIFVRNAMSPLQKSFFRWARFMRDQNKIEYGEAVKAGFALSAFWTKFYNEKKADYLRFAMRKIAYNPERLMRSCFEKMIRAAGINEERAFLAWKMWFLARNRQFADNSRRNLTASNLGNLINKKRRQHLRSGIKPLAKGVADTNMQKRIFNKMYYIAFGRLRIGFTMWKETIDRFREEGEEKRSRIIERLIRASYS